MSDHRSSYPTDVSDEEWAVVAPYLRLLDEKAGQRDHDLREVFNGLRYVVKTGIPWRFMPHDLPPWAAVYQQMQRWLAADCATGSMCSCCTPSRAEKRLMRAVPRSTT